ncbi:MAG: hypothetical protein ABII18_02310 [bacterium]
MNDNFVNIELDDYEIKLIAKYTYPFEEVRHQLETLKGKPGDHVISIDAHEISMLMADLVYSAKKIRNSAVLEELDCLYGILEGAENRNKKSLFKVVE